MNIAKNFVFKFPKVSGMIAVLAAILMMGTLALAPREINHSKAESCPNPPSVPTFNPYPITFGDTAGYNCTDFAPLVARVINGGHYANSQQELSQGITAQNGDEIYVRIYIHNGARQDIDPNQTTARNVRASTSVDTSVGSSHTISTAVSADNAANTLSGSIVVHTDPNSRLEVVPNSGELFDYNANLVTSGFNAGNTTYSLGDQQACFEYAKFIRFKVRVVGAPVSQVSGQISARISNQIDNQCLFNGLVTWSTQNVSQAVITVTDPITGQEKDYATDLNRVDSPAPWITPNYDYLFRLYAIVNGQRTELARTTLRKDFSCQGPVTTSYNLTVNKTEFCVGDTPLYTVTSNNPALAGKAVLWSSTKNGVSTGENDVDYGFRLDNNGNWTKYGGTWDASMIGSWTKTANIDGVKKTVSFTVKDCTVPVTINYELKVNKTEFCVGDTPLYTVTSNNPALSGKAVLWSSTKNGASTGEVDTDYGFRLDSNGNWTKYGGTWDASMIGSWTKSSNIDGVRKSVSFIVKDCTTPVTVNYELKVNKTEFCVGDTPLYTVTSNNSALAGKAILWSSTKNGVSTGEVDTNYGFQLDSNGNWSKYGGTWDASMIGSWTKTANIEGVRKSVSFTVKDCTPTTTVDYTLTVNKAEFCVGDTPLYTITSNNPALAGRTILWSSTKNGVTTGEIDTDYGFKLDNNGNWTKYGGTWDASMIGSWIKTANISGVKKSVSFIVKDCTPVVPQVYCNPSSQTVNVNQAAELTATGGTGTYSWSAPGGSPSSGSSNTFSTSYGSVGNRTVTVTSGSKSATCTVEVKSIPVTVNYNLIINKNEFCVGEAPVYTITSNNPALAGKTILWSSYLNSQPTGEIDTDYGFRLDANGNWSQAGNPWVTANIGSWVKTANIDGVKKSVSFIVKNCEVPQTLSCNPVYQEANTNQPVYFSAMGGNGTYTWSAPGSSKATDTGSSFSTSYDASGTKTVTVTSGSQTASCQVLVKVITPQQLICSPGNISIYVNQAAYFSASGGTGTYSWSAPGGNTTTGSGNVFNTQYASAGSRVVTVTSGTLTANCNVVVQEIPTTPTGGNTINNSYNNTTNNNCVNNSCNYTYYYVTSTGNTVPANEYRQLSITKSVRNINGGSYSNNVTANNNDTVEFEIVVSNVGNQVVNNVRLTDNWNGNLSIVSGSVRVDGSSGYYDNNLSGGINLGSLFTGQQKRVYFQARVNANSGTSIQNIAIASGDNVSSVQDDAWVFVSGVAGGNINLTYSKRAYNDSKNVDAASVPASREDYITYTLTVTNNGNAPANNFIITDDLSQVLPYADMADNGGGTVSGNVISFPGLTIPSGGSVSKSFKVRVKYFLAENLNYVMTNTYGNTVTININTPQVKGAFIAPKTGADTMGLAFGAILTSAFAIVKKRKYLMKLIFA